MLFLWESSLGSFYQCCRPPRFPGDCFLHGHSILQEPSWSRPDPAVLQLYWTLYFGVFPTNSYVCVCIFLTKNISNATLLLVCIHITCFWASFLQNGSTKQFESGFGSIWSSISPDETAKHDVYVAFHGEHSEGGLWNDPPTLKNRAKRSKKRVWLGRDVNHIIQVNRQSLCQISLWNLIGAANQLKG